MAFEQNAHRVKRLPCGDEVIEDYQVLLTGQNVESKHGIHTLFGVAESDIFVKRHAKRSGDPFGD